MQCLSTSAEPQQRRRGAPVPSSTRRAIQERVALGQAMAQRAANVLHARYGWLIEKSELRALAYDGLLRAARAYRPELGVPFCEYAQFRVFGAMQDGVRVEMTSRRVARAAGIAGTLLGSTQVHGRGMRVETISVDDARLRSTVRGVLMESDPSAANDAFDPEARFVATALAARLQAARRQLAAPQQQLVTLVYDRGLELREVAARMRLPYITVRRLHARALRRLAALLRGASRMASAAAVDGWAA